MAELMTAVTLPVATTLPPVCTVRARRVWTCVGLILAVAMVGVGTVSVLGNVAYQPIPLRQRVFTDQLRSVIVNVGTGSVTVEHGSGSRTLVESSGSRGLSWPTDDEHVSGRTLVVRSSCRVAFSDNRCVRNYILQVPQQVSVVANSGEGDIEVAGVYGALDLHSDQGVVTVIGGAGTLRASSGEGDVYASGLTSRSVSATSEQGNVNLGFAMPPDDVTASSGEGDVTIGLPRAPASYQVHASSAQGDVIVGVANVSTSPRVVRASSAQGNVNVRYGRG